MKSTKSSNPGGGKSFWSVFKYDMRRFWYVPALFFLSLMITCPVATILMSDSGKARQEYIANIAGSENPFVSFLLYVMPIAAGLGVFEYLQKTRISNFIHSFPVSRGRLFAANYINGLLMLFLPILITGIVMILFGYEEPGFIRWVLVSWLTCGVMYSITVFAGVVSGTVFMHLFNSLFFSFLITMLIGVVDVFSGMFLFGYTTPEGMSNFLLKSIPVAALYGKATIPTLIIYPIVWILVTLLSLVIYRKRAIENSGQSLVFTWTKSIMVAVVTIMGTCFCGGMLHAMSEFLEGYREELVTLVGMGFGFVAAFLIISVIVYKGTGIFRKGNVVTGIVVLLITVLSTAALSSDVFGYGSRPFESDEFKGMVIEGFPALYDDRFDAAYFDIKPVEGIKKSPGNGMVYTDPGNIKAICSMHDTILANKDEDPGAGKPNIEDAENLTFYGIKKSGRIISRSYPNIGKNALSEMEKDRKIVFESEEFKNAFSFVNLKYIVGSAEITHFKKGEEESVGADMNLKGKKCDSLIEAADRDFRLMTYEEYERGYKLWQADEPTEDYYYVHLNMKSGDETMLSFVITKDQKNTWALLGGPGKKK